MDLIPPPISVAAAVVLSFLGLTCKETAATFCAAVAEALATEQTANVATQLANLDGSLDRPAYLHHLIPALQAQVVILD